MKKEIFTDKHYTHFDVKKHHKDYEQRVKNINWVGKHGFYPFIHFQMGMDKYTNDNAGNKYIKHKDREIYYAGHIDRFIYQYYGNRLNDKYNVYAKQNGINKASTAYRNSTRGKCNIDFAKEVFEFIVNSNSAYILVGDFSKFFDKLDHKYLKEQLKRINDSQSLDVADYAIYKNLIHFSYIEADDIETEKGMYRREMSELDKYFDTKEFHDFKSKHLKKHTENYGIPQGSSISAVYANVYMIEFDQKINDYVTSVGGMYRRYCDDIVIVLPMNEDDKQIKKYEAISKIIFEIKDTVPNLDLNPDKTEQFFFMDSNIEKLYGESNLINYLGFTFDGKKVRIRDKSLFKFYCRAYKKIRKVKELSDEKSFIAGKKAIYRSYTHLGNSRYSKGHGNFLTYAYKAHDIFDESNCLESNIRNQVKRHWRKIDSKLKE
ncbi:reverse transcriptase/maturase family protein [Parasporobacterium paucivorans]|uniref:Reverse transcriptase (RNA-dependent DNA polymerase) n=1 Tax=Parasporobacterium paucivorans DSM 15970 TaxID=1122934 RepID=A0A1M6HZI5_9FIRM|nr:reverse transcriptase/maturase family protein [Parasporobacterium paucivorans]SHJ27580.1 Reverse transcriptase (RNA-dependent DNA polymerase) [Parasporobacterium paucivorans DSM 15970]